MEKDTTALGDFIDSAVRSRKYPENTAMGLRAALKLFEAELNDEEKASIRLFTDRLEQIYSSVCAKNQLKFSAASLATYKSRVVKVLTDYQKYGVDPTKMANWSPKVITRTKRSPSKDDTPEVDTKSAANDGVVDQVVATPKNMHKIELALRVDTPITLVLPRDLRPHEVATITAILKSLTSNGQAENEEADRGL